MKYMSMKAVGAGLLVLGLSGCTSIQVSKVDSQYSDMNHVCIEKNDKVIVEEFLGVVQDRFHTHGVSSEIYVGTEPPAHCIYRMTYTALKTWDVATYLHHAEIRLYKGTNRIGQAEYHLKGKGGLALNKWASVESKMNPVIDDMLANLRIDPNAPKAISASGRNDGVMTSQSGDVYSKLSALKRLRDEGMITEQDYEQKKTELLNSM